MSDMISRQDAIESLIRESTCDGAYGYIDTKSAVETIRRLPYAEPKGKWLNRRIVYTDVHIATCDQCGKRVVVGNFCCNCGADMRGEQE